MDRKATNLGAVDSATRDLTIGAKRADIVVMILRVDWWI
jgi:hypothetical protein